MKFIYFAHYTPSSKGRKFQKESRHKINQYISAHELRVLGEDGTLLGIMSKEEALQLAEDRELDLVEIAPKANPPVAKIIDYGKFIYEQQKREKNQRKQQTAQQMKEIRFKWRTDTHDFNFKTRHARKFLEDGNKVKASIMFRGREITHKDIGRGLLERFIEELADIAKVDQALRSEGKVMHVVLAPDKTKKKQ